MITYLGSYSVGGLMPSMVSMFAGTISNLRSQLNGALRVNGSLTVNLPSLDARIAAVGRVAAALALQPPGVRFNIGANVSVIALLQAQLALIAELQAAFGSAGVEAFVYDGPANSAGSEIAGAIAGGSGGLVGEHIDALVFATKYPATFTAMGTVFVH